MNDSEIEIHVKGGFSERKRIICFSDIVQTNNLNKRTRNLIYTCIRDNIEDFFYKSQYGDQVIEYIYIQILSMIKEQIPYEYNLGQYDLEQIFNMLHNIISKQDFNFVFDMIEGIINFYKELSLSSIKKIFIDRVNIIFKNENVNYKIINDIITDIVNEEETKSVNETLNSSYEIVKKHYIKAVEKLYKDKDYSNSIKESITSVEAMCQIINGSKETLGKALNNLKIEIHPALKSAYSSIYGYTSDENGTRHANGIGEKNATFSEAKYMLISCSAFVNYLKENFEKGK
mgnify:FL=1